MYNLLLYILFSIRWRKGLLHA